MASSDIGLGELINKIKEELESSNKESPAFFVEKVELEIQVTISRDIEVKGQGEAKADLKINVLSIDLLKLGEAKASFEATGTTGRESVHKINLTLTPAILNRDVMNNLDATTQEEIKQSTRRVLVHGDDDRM